MKQVAQFGKGILKKIERHTKTDMVYLAKGGFWLSSSHMINAFFAFTLSIVLANILPKDIYGNYRYILSLAPFMNAFSLTGLNTALVQSVARGFDGALRQSFRSSLIWSIPAALISFSGAIYYFINENHLLAFSLLVIGSFSPLLNSAGLFASFINGKKDFKRYGFYSVIDNVVPSLLLLVAILFSKDVLVLVLAYFVINTSMATILYLRTLHVFKPLPIEDPQLIVYSKKLSLLNILGIITSQIDKVLIFTMLGSVELAVYGVAISFPEQIKALLRNLNILMVPKFADKTYTNGELNLKGKIYQMAFILCLGTIFYIVIAPWLYKLFFPTYPEAVFYSRLFATTLLATLAMVPTSVLIAQKNDIELTKVNTVGAVVQIALLFPFIHFWGLTGVVAARIITAYTNLIIAFWVVRKNYKL